MNTTISRIVRTVAISVLALAGLNIVTQAGNYFSSDPRCHDRETAYKACVISTVAAAESNDLTYAEIDATCKASTARHINGRTKDVIAGCENATLTALVNGQIPLR